MTNVTRIAPSPSGSFHLGTARTAYINYLAARSSNGKFILRIDDTNAERSDDKYTQIIFDSLDWLGLEPDEIYYQSKRNFIYDLDLRELENSGCTKTLENGAIALLWPDKMPESWEDTISKTIPITATNREQIDGRVILRKSDGAYTYQFASVVDDYSLGVNWIIRGVDHIQNTPKQIAIWKSRYWAKEIPRFTHMGLIYCDKKKLSKRDNAASLLWYREQGYCPEAVLNFILRLGWSPKGDNKEHSFISKERAIELFSNGNLSNRPANYDIAKLDNLQKHHGG